MLLAFVFLYLLVTIGIGLWAAKRVKNTADYAIAGLPDAFGYMLSAVIGTA